MTPDVIYLAALTAVANGDPDAARQILSLSNNPAALAAAVGVEGGGGQPAATFRGPGPGPAAGR